MPNRRSGLAALICLAASVAAGQPPPDDLAAKTNPAPGWTARLESAARDHFNNGRWPEAAKAYGALWDANQNQAAFARNFAYACHSLGRYADAAKAWQRALELGFRPADTEYNLACAFSKLDQNEQSLQWLAKALADGFHNDDALRTDTDLDNVRDTPQFRALTGIFPPSDAMSRSDRWKYDLDYFARRAEVLHFDMYRKISREGFVQAIQELSNRVDHLDDAQILLHLQRVVAAIGDDHTRVPILEMALHGNVFATADADGRTGARMYPIDLYLFREGLFIRDASPQHPDLIGCRVLRIGPRSTELALAAARPLCSVDNEMGYRFEAPLLLVQPSVARELSLSDPSGKLPLTILDPQGIERQVLLEPGSPLGGNPFQWLAGRGNPESTEPLPRYLAGVTEPFWYEWVEDQRLVYFQWNAIEETSSRNFADFCAELFDSIERNNAEVLVIDLRHNGGGNNQLLKPFMHGLIRCDRINRPDRLFAIVGRRTASAAMNAAAMLEQESQAIFVGEPTGSSPNHVGEPVVLQLPCTKTQVFISTLFWQNSTAGDGRTWIAPRIVAEPTWAAHQANRDPAMDAICQYMATVGV